MTYVTDTHPLIWFLDRNQRLSPGAGQAFSDPSARIAVPTIVLVEIKFLFSRNRVTIDLPTTLHYVANTANCTIAPMDERVVDRLPTTLNIHDAIIVGTALVHRDVLGDQVALITRDAEITASGLLQVIW
jgi:PIN domain nuclease of toxin-antitoxin system